MAEQIDLMTGGAPLDTYFAAASAPEGSWQRAAAIPLTAVAFALGTLGAGVVTPRPESSTVFTEDDQDLTAALPRQRQPWEPKPSEQFRYHGKAALKIGPH